LDGLADQLDAGALDAFRVALSDRAALGILGFDAFAIALEHLAVGLVGAQRLAVRQQVVAGVAVLHADHVADGAELFDAFEQDDIHVGRSLLHDVGEEAEMARALDRLGEFALLLGGHRGDAAGTILPRSDTKPCNRRTSL
jgi:hypothetical protein